MLRYNISMSNLPKEVLKFFWGDKPEELDWEKHKVYISKTILGKGDVLAIKWLLKKADKKYLRNIVETKRLDPKSKNFWSIYLS